MTHFSPSSIRRTLHVALVCGAVVVSGAARAHAEDEPAEPRARARALLQEGAHFMEERQYDKAVETFREAYRLVPSPKILFNLGIAYLSVARYADALGAFEGFLKDATDAPAASEATARRLIAEARSKVATLAITSDRPGAELFLDGRSLGAVTFDHDLTIDAGPHELHATAGDKTVDLHFSAPPEQRVTLALTFEGSLPATPPAAPVTPDLSATSAPLVSSVAAPPPARPLLRRPWFWVAAGGAVAALATVILVVALSHTDNPAFDVELPGPR